MGRLFVDCDDTLVLWLDNDKSAAHQFGYGATEWKPNTDLIDAITKRRHEYESVIVWSGGGVEYASRWLERLLPWADFCATKDTRLPRADDTCIDDMVSLKVAGRLVTPGRYVEESMKEGKA